jgi:hypothetical protein
MLVVLLIVALAGGLLMEAGAHVMNLQARANTMVGRLRTDALQADWLRQVVEGLQPDYQGAGNGFKGNAQGFTGLTTNPLSGSYGGLDVFAVVLSYDQESDRTDVRYVPGQLGTAMDDLLQGGAWRDGTVKDAKPPAVLMSWSGRGQKLRYWDDKGEPHENWPPAAGTWPQLPERVSLEGERDGTAWLVVAGARGPVLPVVRPTDLIGGM